MNATVTQLHPSITNNGHNEPLTIKAMLVRLSITKCPTAKADKKVTAEIAQQHNADQTILRFTRQLFTKEALCKIDSPAQEARDYHYKHTIPWKHSPGWALLPTASYLPYVESMRKLRVEFEESVDEFGQQYQQHCGEGKRRNGDLTTEEDYPHVGAILSRFGFDTKFAKVPEGADLNIPGLVDEAEIRKQIDRDVQEAVADAMKDVWQRVATQVGHMAERLKAYVPAGPKETYKTADGKIKTRTGTPAENVYRDSLIQNIRELVDVLPMLNITNDPKLAAIIDQMRADLCIFDAEQLRESDTLRSEVADKAQAILDQVSEMLA